MLEHKLWLYLIEMQYLLEDRLDFLRTNFHDRVANLLNTVAMPATIKRRLTRQPGDDDATKLINLVIFLDPDPQKKNTQWLLTSLVRKNHAMPLEDLQYATETLTKYAEMKQARQIPREHMDINAFRSLSEINAVIRGEQQQMVSADETEQQEMMQEAKVLYDGPDARVLVPLTQKAACYFGRNTEWCTAWGDHLKLGLRQQGRHPGRSSHYASYTGGDKKLYIIEIKPNGPIYQYSSEHNQFMDVKDVELSPQTVRELFKQHPNIMKAIGEEKFIRTHLNVLGAKYFSPTALLSVNPRMLLGSVQTLQDFNELPDEVKRKPEIIAAVLMALPRVAAELPDSVMTPEVAEALRQATAQHQASDTIIAAFNRFPIAQWSPQVIYRAITQGSLEYQSIVDASHRMETVVDNVDGYRVFRLPDRIYGSDLYLIISPERQHWYWATTNGDDSGKLEWLGSPDQSTNDALTPILNALQLPPTFALEGRLMVGNIYFGKQYGPLSKVGKPDIKVGDVTLHRLGARHVWIGIQGKELPKRLWLKGTTLEHEIGIQLGKLDPNIAVAVRELAVKYKAKKVANATYFGMINGPNYLIADFPRLLAYAQKFPDIAYVDTESKKRDFYLAMSNWKNLSPEQQQALYDVLRSDELKVETTETERIYDMTIPHLYIRFPLTNGFLLDTGVYTDKSIKSKIVADLKHSLRAAIVLLNKQQYAELNLTPPERMPALANMLNILNRVTEKLYHNTSQAKQERMQNREKYAAQSDLSGRFAALNAFNRRGY